LTAFITKTQGTEELITWIDPEKSVTPKQEVLVRLGIALDFAEAVKQQTDGKAKDEEIVVSFTMLRPGFDGGSVSEAIQRVEKPDFLEVHKATQALARREFSKEIAATTEKYFDIPGRK
jgi:hypothetical protein